MKGIRFEYRPCPECTYPLRSYMSVKGEITYIVSKCSNKRCSYTRRRKVKDKKAA